MANYKLVLNVGDKEIELSRDEVFELKQLLDEMFPSVEYVPWQQPYLPIYPPNYPWVTYTSDTVEFNK
jgi:hypothetical protein